MNPNQLLSKRTRHEAKKRINDLHTQYDPETVLKRAEEKITRELESEDGPDEEDPELPIYDDPIYRAMTLAEFKNGALMAGVISAQYRTFAIDLLRKIQDEYQCSKASEQSLAEVATLSFIRTLEIQGYLNGYLSKGTITELGTKYLAILSKELDRANRHHLSALQTLKMMKQPSFSVNVKAHTAIVGQNQLIQENQNVKSI